MCASSHSLLLSLHNRIYEQDNYVPNVVHILNIGDNLLLHMASASSNSIMIHELSHRITGAALVQNFNGLLSLRLVTISSALLPSTLLILRTLYIHYKLYYKGYNIPCLRVILQVKSTVTRGDQICVEKLMLCNQLAASLLGLTSASDQYQRSVEPVGGRYRSKYLPLGKTPAHQNPRIVASGNPPNT